MPELLLGLSLGLAAGFSPGPLLTLVLTTTLQRGLLAGMRVGLSPLITDAPIILLCVFVVRSLPASVAPLLSLGGGLFVLYLGVQTLREARHASLEFKPTADGTSDMWRGMVVNALSPHPWLFWLGVGAPTLVRAWQLAPVRGLAFLLGFYLLLVGCKLLLAAALAFGRRWLNQSLYRFVLAGCGVLLGGAGVFLLLEAARGFGWL